MGGNTEGYEGSGRSGYKYREALKFTPTAIVRIVQEVAQKVTGQITENVDPFEDTAISETEDLDTETATRISEIQRLSASDPLAVDEYQRVARLCEHKAMLFGRVISMQCFQAGRHEFILVHTKGFFFRDDPRKHAWIRIERWTDDPDNDDWKDKVKAAFKKPKTYNRFKVSFDERSLLPPDAVAQETLEFQDFVGLDHLITLLELVEKAPLDYSLLKDNSWFFCQAIIDCMENYQPKPINLRRFFIGQDRRLQLKKDFAEAIGSKLRSYRYSP
ncbi:hypothetical protein RhiJN_25904 [Ceratobasidium sp. AG-Ba]|nr:hypothetical protein RhiJN_25904 [Ceratobasidium sp. AG-Ba]